METLIINFFGSPSAGKSTQAAGLFYKLKMKGTNCELITEYAKDATWEKNFTALENQFFTTANQVYRQERVEGKVDVLITDSPIILGLFYWNPSNKSKYEYFKKFLLEVFFEKNTINVFVRRKHAYSQIGRNQTENEAEDIGDKILSFLDENKIQYFTIDGTPGGLEEVYDSVNIKLNKMKQTRL